MTRSNEGVNHYEVNLCDPPRSFATAFKSDVKETLFPDDPFRQFRNDPHLRRAYKALQYFIPVLDWLPRYNLRLFRYDLLAGITIASLAIPQGISYAKLANIPVIIGLYSSFVPPLIYAVFGNSKHLAVGPVAASSLLIAATIGEKVSVKDNPTLYLHLVFTATFVTGVFQAILGFLRLGILVDFLSHSTIIGFMGGTATLICLQQLKGMLGLKHFTTKTDVISVMHSIFSNRDEWRWECAVVGVCFLAFLLFTRHLKKKNPKLFWVSAIAPMVVVIIGCIFAYFSHAEKHGIQIVGHLNKGLNPLSIEHLNFDAKYISAPLKAGIITGILALAEGIAIGRSFAIMNNEQVDGNKEMIAFGLMNIVGSFTSCYLTTGPFSKTAVNFNAGCKTAMSNVVMSICMMLVLLFLAPLFSYTPLVALSAIIMAAMLGLIEYNEAYRLFKVDKFDFFICMAAFFGVAFISMDIGLMLSISISVLRALLYVARPAPCRLANIPSSTLFRDVEQYPGAEEIPGILILQLGSPIYFANCTYIRERISRWIKEEQMVSDSNVGGIEHILLDLGGVTSIDMTGIETLLEIQRNMVINGIKMAIVNPRIEVMEKLIISKFVDKIGKEYIFLSIEDAIKACQFSLSRSKMKSISEDSNIA
ncbi:probable sulfate transporter 3.5 [Malania oleifera]|uniref:probable sulfate transporter 3.5 n=1 Tax=Malania oleifera TaxID=397392 RepID=UPI0025ADD235|nr:probable sulfate transporter 3.5 [Malania oleifera]XP_057968390.1 probable sulfate transporter 3.5 [Malania oleifera]